MLKSFIVAATAAASLTVPSLANAETTIGFEGFNETTTLEALGIRDSYLGYNWGFAAAGYFSPTFCDCAIGGWALESALYPTGNLPRPQGYSGQSFAWNYNGPRSLWIDFRQATDVLRVSLSRFVGSDDYYFNAATVRIFGYDDDLNALGSTSAFALSNGFQTFDVGLSNVRYVEFRADDGSRWFALDDLVVDPIPEPSTWAMLVLGFLGAGAMIRRDQSARRAA